MDKSKTNVDSNVRPTSDKKPTSTEILTYQHLTEEQYDIGLAFTRDKGMGVEYGHRMQEGFYLSLFPDGRSDKLIADFEAALG